MPWKVAKRGTKWVVVKADTGKVVGTHDSKAEAVEQKDKPPIFGCLVIFILFLTFAVGGTYIDYVVFKKIHPEASTKLWFLDYACRPKR